MADLGSNTSLVTALSEIEKKVIQAEKDRNNLETNLKNKDVEVVPGSKMSTLIDNVGKIKLGKKWASGNITDKIILTPYSSAYQIARINFNLDFTPSKIVLSFQSATIYSSIGTLNTSIDSDFANSESSYCELHSDERQPLHLYIRNITAKGFDLYWKRTNSNGTYTINPKITWYAYE